MNTNQQNVWIQLMLSFSKRIDARISLSGGHSAQVASLGKSTARQLDCSEQDIQTVHWAALLHDVGKLGVPERILTKAGPLTEKEWLLIKLHPTVGANMVQMSDSMAHVAPVIYAHQERYDGSGYPEGLRGDEIPLGARILAVVDAYEAMTNDRYYRKARLPEEALTELRRNVGGHFDPQVVQAFLNVINV